MKSFFDRLSANTETDRERLVSASLIRDTLKGEIVREEYLAFLEQAYHHVKHTVPLLMATGARLRPHQHWLQRSITEYIKEEVGHEEWILSDIAAAGGQPEKVRVSRPNNATEMMVAYAYYQIDRVNPIGFFGMVHVLEGTSIALATRAATSIKQSLGLPDNAFSYLNSHGSLDLEHIEFFKSLVNDISDLDDQAEVIFCAKRFYWLYGEIFRTLPRKQLTN